MLIVTMALLVGMTARDTSMRIPISGAESLHVEVRGKGTTVVLLPGLLGSAFAYRDVVGRLASQGHRTIVIEPLGFGQSSKPRDADYSLTAQAQRVAVVLDSLRVDRAIVVAHATASGIALRLAIVRPSLVASIISINGGAAESAGTPGIRRAVALAPVVRIVGAGGVRSRVRAGLIEASGDARWVNDGVVRSYTRHATDDLGATLAAYRGMVNSRERIVLGTRLHELECSVVILVGSVPHAGAITGSELDWLKRTVRDLRVEEVPGAGSYLHEERPDVVADAVVRTVSAPIPNLVVRSRRS